MIKKIIAAILILTAGYIYLYFQPISVNTNFAMEGSIRSTDGETISPCAVKFDGCIEYYVLGNKPDGLTGTLQLTSETTITSTIYLELSNIELEGIPLQLASGIRYRGKALGPIPCSIYFNKDRSACVLIDNTTIYCVGSADAAEAILAQVAKLPLPTQ